MSAAVYLAHEIEWAHARERAKLRFPTRKLTKEIIAAEFDPHAATELADLIEHRMRAKAAAPAEARGLYPEWRPIETAPWELAPGEQWMLLWNGHWRGVGRRYAGYDDDPGFCDETTEFIEPAPSHWMPLPAPPKDEAE